MKLIQKIHITTLSTILAFGLIACTEDKGDDSAAPSSDGYSMTVCPVSGEKLGSMGTPVVMTHEGTTVKLCCDHCTDKFKADPEKYVAMVKEAK